MSTSTVIESLDNQIKEIQHLKEMLVKYNISQDYIETLLNEKMLNIFNVLQLIRSDQLKLIDTNNNTLDILKLFRILQDHQFILEFKGCNIKVMLENMHSNGFEHIANAIKIIEQV